MFESPTYEFVVFHKKSGREISRNTLLKTTCEYGSCNTMVSIGRPYCKRHLDRVLGLRIGLSPALAAIGIQGNGVFATRPFATGQVIMHYDCVKLNADELASVYGNSAVQFYTLEDRDAAADRIVASIINDAKGLPGCRNNVEFGQGDPSEIVAISDIKSGDELFISYGREYWRGYRRCKTSHVTRLVPP